MQFTQSALFISSAIPSLVCKNQSFFLLLPIEANRRLFDEALTAPDVIQRSPAAFSVLYRCCWYCWAIPSILLLSPSVSLPPLSSSVAATVVWVPHCMCSVQRIRLLFFFSLSLSLAISPYIWTLLCCCCCCCWYCCWCTVIMQTYIYEAMANEFKRAKKYARDRETTATITTTTNTNGWTCVGKHSSNDGGDII